jgi:hypothetical protein
MGIIGEIFVWLFLEMIGGLVSSRAHPFLVKVIAILCAMAFIGVAIWMGYKITSAPEGGYDPSVGLVGIVAFVLLSVVCVAFAVRKLRSTRDRE